MSFYLQKHPGLRFHAEYNISWGEFHVWMMHAVGDGNPRFIKDVTLHTAEEDHDPGQPAHPAMKMSVAEAQALMDALWTTGLRPSDHKQKPDNGPVVAAKDEVIAAKDEHIGDLRRITFVEPHHDLQN